MSANGECHEFLAIPDAKPEAWLDATGRICEAGSVGATKNTLERFSIGSLKGFEMALQDLKTQGYNFQFRDRVTIECTGHKDTGDKNKDDMIMFSVTPSR